VSRVITFYTTVNGSCPIKEFLDSLPAKAAQKVTWVLSLLEDLDIVPSSYFKKLVGTEEIWECRIQSGSNTYRIFCFFIGNSVVVRTHCQLSENTKTGDRKGTELQERLHEEEDETMSDLKKYIAQRKKRDKKYAEGYKEGYEQFKIGVMLRHARESAGLTQEELAIKLNTRKTAISRIENHAEDIKLSTLERFAAALGKQLRLQIS